MLLAVALVLAPELVRVPEAELPVQVPELFAEEPVAAFVQVPVVEFAVPEESVVLPEAVQPEAVEANLLQVSSLQHLLLH